MKGDVVQIKNANSIPNQVVSCPPGPAGPPGQKVFLKSL